MVTSSGPTSNGDWSQPGGVFLSWTRTDTARDGLLGGLVDRLVARGVPVWIDDGQIATFDPIPQRIRQGLAQAKVLLAWYSAAYPTRRACREELTLALLAAQRHHQPDRVLVVNPEPDARHLLEAPLLNTRFASQPDLDDLDRLADRIAERVKAQPAPLGELPAADRVTWHGAEAWVDGSRRFAGRLKELWTLHDMLCRTTELVGPGQAGRALALVSGFGGVGKSLLTAEYARLFASSYPGGVVWLSALGNDTTGRAPEPGQSQTAAASAYADLASSWLRLDVQGLDPAALREAVREELIRRDKQVLWVVDDLPSGLDAAAMASWRCPSPVTHELITTRDRTHSSLPSLELGVLAPDDALNLLLQDHPWPAPEREQARILAEDLGRHPLACDVAGLYVAGGSTFTAYRRLIQGSLARFDELAAQLSDQLPGGHQRQIVATLGTSLTRLTPAAQWVLRAAAHLGAWVRNTRGGVLRERAGPWDT